MDTDHAEKPLEYQVFALAFRKPGAMEYFGDNLPPEAMGLNGQGLFEFYAALLHFHRKTGLECVEPIAFRSWLESETHIYDVLGGAPVVTSFIDTMLGLELSTPEAVATVLRHRLNKRHQLEFLQELQSMVTKKTGLSDEETQRLGYLTDQIHILEGELDYSPLEQVNTALDISASAGELFNLPDFLPTQFKSLNRAMGYSDNGGFCKGAVHGVLAASGQGKSTFVKCLANNWADQGYSVLYINYEEAQAHWERILFTQITKKNIYFGVESKDEKEELLEIFRDRMAQWGDNFMVRHDPDTPYFDDLERWLRDINGHKGRNPDVVIIDTIQSMFMKGGAGKPRWGQFEEMMVRLEKLAKEMNAAFIITGQENSNRMKEKREVVVQSDAGGSLTIIQKCAVTIFITQKKLAAGGDDAEDATIMQLQIPKNRITGGAFALDPPLVRYNDATKSYEEFELPDPEEYDPTTTLAPQLSEGDFYS